MPAIPRHGRFDSTLALLRDPYGFIAKRSRRFGSDVFQTRLLLHPTICMTGPATAALFYDEDRFMRRGATPRRVQKVLFGEGGVQGLDGEAHRHRKQMFLSLMTPERIDLLADQTADWLRAAAHGWSAQERVVLYDALRTLLTRAVCAWSGVPLADAEVDLRTRKLTAMFTDAATIGPAYWRGRLARKRAERWAQGIIEEIRAGRGAPPEESAAHVISRHRDLNGALLDPRVAAVELLNVLRPTVAVAVYLVFVAHALHQHPAWRDRLRDGNANEAEILVQEVRRFYPFFPAVAARVRHDFAWQGYPFPRGRRVILDLYGTNHDPRAWDSPAEFRPERFRDWDGSPFTFVPQGGGGYAANHRCAGEWITIALLKIGARFLTRGMTYEVPEQDLRIDRRRPPALPKSGFVIGGVRLERSPELG